MFVFSQRRIGRSRRFPRAAVGAVATVAFIGGLTGCSGKPAAHEASCKSGIAVFNGPCPSGNSLTGDSISPPVNEPNLTMTDTAGNPYNIETANPGKTVLVYYGYTHCPDLCPRFMADAASAIRQLRQTDPAVAAKLQLVFITVDPVRDTRPVLARWLHQYSPHFVGLRAPIPQVIKAQKAMDVPTSRILHNGHYTVQHSAELVVFTPDHENHLVYTEGPDTVSDLVHDLPLIVNNQAWQ